MRKGSGSHPRIGYDFLYAGAGYGGSCFPKDVKALIKTAHNASIDLKLLKAVEAANERQKHVLVDKVVARFGDNLAGRHFGLWGLAFKPNTDDMREAPSRVIIVELLRKGAAVKACDPKAMAAARSVLPVGNELRLVDNQQEVLAGSEALVIVTDWKEFKNPDFETIKALLKQPVVIDGHTLYEPTLMQSLGFEYIGIGRAGTLALTEQSGSRRSPG